MPRARNLKPGFFRNADLAELPVEARLLFAGLWTLADRVGLLADRPRQIKMEIYPADDFDVDALLQQLHDAGFIQRYRVGGVGYIRVLNFTRHQNPHHSEKASGIPLPESPWSTPGVPPESSRSPRVSPRAIPESGGGGSGYQGGVHPEPSTSPPEAKPDAPPGCADAHKNMPFYSTGYRISATPLEYSWSPPGQIVLIPDSRILIPESPGERQRNATTVGPAQARVDSGSAPGCAPDEAPVTGEENPSSGVNPQASVASADVISMRAVQIAALLRARGAGVAAGEVRLREWAQRGVSDAALLAALETAQRRRADAGSVQPVNSGLLDSILGDAAVPSGGARASPGSGRQGARERYVAAAAAAEQRLVAAACGDGAGMGVEHGRNERDISGECARVA